MGALVIQAFVLVVGFAVGAGGLVTPIAAVGAALLGLSLRDAYKSSISVSAWQCFEILLLPQDSSSRHRSVWRSCDRACCCRCPL
jgi:hypothetical protein